MRSVLLLVCALAPLAAIPAVGGCAERDPLTPSDVATTPQCARGVPVVALAAPIEPLVAAPAPRPVRLQQTVSLGYAGDGPLTQIEPRREWWGEPDHAVYGGYGYGYGGPAVRNHDRGAVSHGPQARGQGQPGMATRGGGHAAPHPAPVAHGPR